MNSTSERIPEKHGSEPRGIFPSVADFARQAGENPVVPVWIELVADTETPLSLLAKLGEKEPSFLLESAEQSDLVGQYSFVGCGARAVIESRGDQIKITDREGLSRSWIAQDPLRELEELMSGYRCAIRPELPGFSGGAVGYLGYEAVRRFEPTVPAAGNDDLDVPEMLFLIADTVAAFDHRSRRIKVIACAFPGELGIEASRREALERISRLLLRISEPSPLQPFPIGVETCTLPVVSNLTRESFEKAVEDSQEFIRAGDIFQIVLSQRFSMRYAGDPLHLYRALRFVNPSPYMFCLRFPGRFSMVGSSPEVHVKVVDGLVEIRPIAGTRKRGTTPEADELLRMELLDDPKERSEHLMLLDLGRNDVGRVAEIGSVRVTDSFFLEFYSQVMHIVSNVEGRLDPRHDALSALAAGFPAGTVSGAPKVRAMQIIDELEREKRGPYGGCIGYFGADGQMDTCIVLRTAIVKDGRMHVQAGAGIVHDSDPASEQQECVNKAKALFRAAEEAVRFAAQARRGQ